MFGLRGSPMRRRPLLKRPHELRVDVSDCQLTHRACNRAPSLLAPCALPIDLAMGQRITAELGKACGTWTPPQALQGLGASKCVPCRPRFGATRWRLSTGSEKGALQGRRFPPDRHRGGLIDGLRGRLSKSQFPTEAAARRRLDFRSNRPPAVLLERRGRRGEALLGPACPRWGSSFDLARLKSAARSQSAVTANSSAVPSAALVSGQRFEFSSILASGGAAETPRFANSAVFAAVTSKSGRRFGQFVSNSSRRSSARSAAKQRPPARRAQA